MRRKKHGILGQAKFRGGRGHREPRRIVTLEQISFKVLVEKLQYLQRSGQPPKLREAPRAPQAVGVEARYARATGSTRAMAKGATVLGGSAAALGTYRLASCAAPDGGQAFARQLGTLVRELPGWSLSMGPWL